MSGKKKELDPELVKFRDSYVEMFGSLPPLPGGRFAFSGDMNPEFLRDAERMRSKAFYNKTFDMKTTQLILFGMLLVEHNQIAAQARASAARRAGASWEELHTVVELASATGALYPFNQGSALLNGMREKETGGSS
jgi:alkylhydroperoxidase/carboxymuconolactone decarboxylase family protein YurZ